jgi:glycine/D-amino acid oxidase-like deaminating enzyme
MRDEPGLVVRLGCHSVPIGRAMHTPQVEVRPDRPRQVVIHSRAVDGLIGTDTDVADLSERLVGLATDVVPAPDSAELIEARIAWRPIPVHGFPSVGAVDGLPGYFEAVTHSGISLGPVIGRLLAREIVDRTVDELIEPYRPGRL